MASSQVADRQAGGQLPEWSAFAVSLTNSFRSTVNNELCTTVWIGPIGLFLSFLVP